jgi:uncharacterized protein YciI
MSDEGGPAIAYAVVELRRGPRWSAGVTMPLIGLQLRHLRTLWRLRRAGLLLLAGPIPGEDAVRGLVICRVKDVDRVVAALERDPAVRAGRLTVAVASSAKPAQREPADP